MTTIDSFTFDYRNQTDRHTFPGIKVNLPIDLLTAFPKCHFCFSTELASRYKYPYGKESKNGVHTFSTLQLLEEFSSSRAMFSFKRPAIVYHSMLFLIKGNFLPSKISLTIYDEDNVTLRYFEGSIKQTKLLSEHYGTLVDFQLQTALINWQKNIDLCKESLKRKRESVETTLTVSNVDCFAKSTYEDLEKLFQ